MSTLGFFQIDKLKYCLIVAIIIAVLLNFRKYIRRWYTNGKGSFPRAGRSFGLLVQMGEYCLTTLGAHFVKVTSSFQQIIRRVKFKYFTGIKHQNSVTVNYGVESVGNGEYGTGGEFTANRSLNQSISDMIYIRGCFITDENLISSKNSSSKADQLSLADAKISSVVRQFSVKFAIEMVYGWLELYLLQCRPKGMVGILTEWIEIITNGSGENDWILWDDGYLSAKIVQANGGNVNAVNADGACWFGQTEECSNNWTFAGYWR